MKENRWQSASSLFIERNPTSELTRRRESKHPSPDHSGCGGRSPVLGGLASNVLSGGRKLVDTVLGVEKNPADVQHRPLRVTAAHHEVSLRVLVNGVHVLC